MNNSNVLFRKQRYRVIFILILLLNVEQYKLNFRYDPANGKFVADRPGLYYFAVHLLSKQNDEFSNTTTFSIQKNEETQCNAYLEIDTTSVVNLHPSCSSTVELMPGDEVYVDCCNVYTLSVGSGYTAFTGFLIQPYL